MSATRETLALRYLLELSGDILSAALMNADGSLLAFVPETRGGEARRLVTELVREAAALWGDPYETAEIDAICEDGAVFLVRDGDFAMVCVTRRSVLAGLIFHDMHAVLADLERAASEGGRRTERAATRSGGGS